MRYVTIAVFLACILTTRANIIEDKEPGILEVQYVKTCIDDTLTARSHSDPMTLRVGITSSMFYPTKRMWEDSLKRTNFNLHTKLYYEVNPIGTSEWKPLGGSEGEYLFRNVVNGETLVYRRIAGDGYSYTEPTEAPVWTIQSDTKEILGYQCQMATCDFRGRKWNAWFTPEIPVKEGPWKLFGLPGLVLAASDSKNHYSYEATGILNQNLRPVGIRLYVREKPIKLKSRQAFLKKIYDEVMSGKFVAAMSSMHGNGSQTTPEKSQYDNQERDYPH